MGTPKIDFVLIGKIDDLKRYDLLMQTMQTFNETVKPEFVNRFVFVDDVSGLALPYGFPITPFNSLYERNETQLGVGGSKNKGVEIHTKFGRGDLLYMFDGDVFFTEGWLEKLLEAHKICGNKYKILAGGIHPYLQFRANEGTNVIGNLPRLDSEPPYITSHDAISGWSWLLDYDTWDKYGKLADNALGTGKSEDWEYCQRIRNDGFLVGCVQPQVIAHCGMTNSEGEPIVGKDVSEGLAKAVAPKAILL